MSRTFEIVGIHHENHGAVLMLEAALEQLSGRYRDARFALAEATPVDFRLAYRARTAWPSEIRGARAVLSARLAARRGNLRRFGVVTPSEVDVRFDASGFSYGDFWGLQRLEARLLRPLKAFPERPIVLLPQAFGPFRKPGMASAVREAMARVALAFVRDDQSMAFLEDAGVKESDRIRRAPDFTNLLHEEEASPADGPLLVIPNQKVVDAASGVSREDYLAFLCRTVEAGRAAGHTTAFLVHEGANDRALAEEANQRLDTPCKVIDGKTPLETKRTIASAAGVVSSRFHGLVSALASATPALAVGWSHKYQMLMGSYGLSELVVDLGEPQTFDAKLAALFALMGEDAARCALRGHARSEREEAERMWSRVFAFVDEL